MTAVQPTAVTRVWPYLTELCLSHVMLHASILRLLLHSGINLFCCTCDVCHSAFHNIGTQPVLPAFSLSAEPAEVTSQEYIICLGGTLDSKEAVHSLCVAS